MERLQRRCAATPQSRQRWSRSATMRWPQPWQTAPATVCDGAKLCRLIGWRIRGSIRRASVSSGVGAIGAPRLPCSGCALWWLLLLWLCC